MDSLSADIVARVIVEAARLTQADPIVVRAKPHHQGNEFVAAMRARVYSARALAILFPDLSKGVIGRVVGSPNFGSFVASIESRRRKGQIKWYNALITREVVTRTRERFPELDRKEVAPRSEEAEKVVLEQDRSGYVSLAVAPKDIRQSLLYDAVRNTK